MKKRLDMALDKKPAVMAKAAAGLKALKPTETSDMDGLRAVFRDGWILLRASGTEPKLKIVVEAETEHGARKLLASAEKIATEAMK